ncbi:MAG TPA: PTS sugar transporter subunit IIA [Candidatus Binataceae bacterium]|jgi:PTS system nitrogen regulatory IIA component|nr:PTS sugar transporter subunit IIA [Candidatus Binataceae bacterium]
MKITEILTPEMVIPQMRGGSKPEVLSELAQCLCQAHPEVVYDRLLGVLNERERLGSTAIGDGIAIPHGKLRGITKILGVFGRSTAGVDFDSLDGNPTQLFFLLIAPEDSASLHLKALARVSRLFKDAGFRQHLLEAPDAAEIYRLLKEEDSKY